MATSALNVSEELTPIHLHPTLQDCPQSDRPENFPPPTLQTMTCLDGLPNKEKWEGRKDHPTDAPFVESIDK